jgi:RHS repeat-associated protein
LDYAINRHYDSQQGRFTQVDPIGINASSLDNPQSLNLYAYCGNDPVNHVDPSGLFWGKLFRAIGKISKVFNKIVKWALIALAVAVVVVAIVISPQAAVQLLMGVAKFLIKIGVFKETPLIYGAIEGGSKIGIGIVGKILAGIEAVGALSNHLQKSGKKAKKEPPCPPTKDDLIMKGSKSMHDAFNKAWEKSMEIKKETGGWIFMDKAGRLSAVLKEVGPNDDYFSVYLNAPPNLPGKVVVGTFHVHLDDVGPSLYGTNGPGDMGLSNSVYKVPGIIIRSSQYEAYGIERGIWKKGPPPKCQQ